MTTYATVQNQYHRLQANDQVRVRNSPIHNILPSQCSLLDSRSTVDRKPTTSLGFIEISSDEEPPARPRPFETKSRKRDLPPSDDVIEILSEDENMGTRPTRLSKSASLPEAPRTKNVLLRKSLPDISREVIYVDDSDDERAPTPSDKPNVASADKTTTSLNTSVSVPTVTQPARPSLGMISVPAALPRQPSPLPLTPPSFSSSIEKASNRNATSKSWRPLSSLPGDRGRPQHPPRVSSAASDPLPSSSSSSRSSSNTEQVKHGQPLLSSWDPGLQHRRKSASPRRNVLSDTVETLAGSSHLPKPLARDRVPPFTHESEVSHSPDVSMRDPSTDLDLVAIVDRSSPTADHNLDSVGPPQVAPDPSAQSDQSVDVPAESGFKPRSTQKSPTPPRKPLLTGRRLNFKPFILRGTTASSNSANKSPFVYKTPLSSNVASDYPEKASVPQKPPLLSAPHDPPSSDKGCPPTSDKPMPLPVPLAKDLHFSSTESAVPPLHKPALPGRGIPQRPATPMNIPKFSGSSASERSSKTNELPYKRMREEANTGPVIKTEDPGVDVRPAERPRTPPHVPDPPYIKSSPSSVSISCAS